MTSIFPLSLINKTTAMLNIRNMYVPAEYPIMLLISNLSDTAAEGFDPVAVNG